MCELVVEGGVPLAGELTIQGSKNSVLPILAATLLTADTCTIENCPRLRDVDASISILRNLGCCTHWESDALVVDTAQMDQSEVPDALMREMRSSVIFLGAILARSGEATLSYPGGCELGPRPIDIHLSALRALGAEISECGGKLKCRTDGLIGCEIFFPMSSVGATENTILAACGAEGTTVLYNAAREPEIVDLQNFINAMGGNVRGAGGSIITVEGGRTMHGGLHRVIADRIVGVIYFCVVASCGGEVLLRRTDARMIQSVTALLRQTGCELLEEQNAVLVRKTGKTGIISDVKTAVYPGFPTDCQAILTAALLRAEGESRIEETVFEDRFHHVPELQKLGAKLEIYHNTVHISGVRTLSGAKLTARDLRGGAALVLAAMQAEEESRVEGLTHIDRGYERFAEKLRALGANIERCFDA